MDDSYHLLRPSLPWKGGQLLIPSFAHLRVSRWVSVGSYLKPNPNPPRSSQRCVVYRDYLLSSSSSPCRLSPGERASAPCPSCSWVVSFDPILVSKNIGSVVLLYYSQHGSRDIPPVVSRRDLVGRPGEIHHKYSSSQITSENL